CAGPARRPPVRRRAAASRRAGDDAAPGAASSRRRGVAAGHGAGAERPARVGGRRRAARGGGGQGGAAAGAPGGRPLAGAGVGVPIHRARLAAVAGEPGWRPGRSVPPAAAHAPDRRARAVERLAAAHRRAGQPVARRQARLPLPRRTAGTGAVSADLDVTLAMMPAPLAALVRAELAAGNEVVEVGRAVPAPSVIAFVKLAQPVTTRP